MKCTCLHVEKGKQQSRARTPACHQKPNFEPRQQKRHLLLLEGQGSKGGRGQAGVAHVAAPGRRAHQADQTRVSKASKPAQEHQSPFPLIISAIKAYIFKASSPYPPIINNLRENENHGGTGALAHPALTKHFLNVHLQVQPGDILQTLSGTKPVLQLRICSADNFSS